MATAQRDRLDAVRSELDNALAQRIGSLMGVVKASRDVVRRITDADAEIARREEDLERVTDGADREEIQADLQVIREVREKLVDDLVRLTEELR